MSKKDKYFIVLMSCWLFTIVIVLTFFYDHPLRSWISFVYLILMTIMVLVKQFTNFFNE